MQKILLLVLLSIFNTIIFSQDDKERDSLLQVIKTSKSDSSIIDAYQELCRYYFEINPHEGIKYGTIGLKLAQTNEFKIKQGRLHQSIGICYDYKNDLDSCLYHLNVAVAIFKQLNKPDAQSHAIADIAFAHYLRGNYELALRNHLLSLELRKQVGIPRFVAISQSSLGLVYRAKKDYTKAIYYYKQSINTNTSINLKTGVLNNYINLSSAYENKKVFDSAFFFAQKGFLLADSLQKQTDVLSCKLNMASALVSLQKNEEAFLLLNQLKKNTSLFTDKRNDISFYKTYAEVLYAKQEFKQAISFAQIGISKAKILGWKEQTISFYELLAKSNAALSNYKWAYTFADSGKAVSEKIFNQENIRQVNELTAVYETVEKEKQINKLTTENTLKDAESKSRKTERNYFILSSILFLSLAVIALHAFLTNKKQKEKLGIQNGIIEKSLAEKEILLREIHHRVKNNLQIVSSLLSLQSVYIQDDKALHALLEGKNRVESMGLIHQHLYQDENLALVNIENYIANLCDNLFLSYNIQPNTIILQKNIQTINIDVDTVIPLGLILNELITNCLKYAFVDKKEKGIISIILAQENNNIKLCVHDNGVGLPANFDIKSKKSFGYRMIQAFLQKLKATINVYTNNGTRVDIVITNFKQA